MTIGERVLDLLKEKGGRQKELAEALGIGESTVSQWGKPNRNPSSELIIPICEFLNVSPHYLLTGKEDLFSKLDDEDLECLKLITSLPPDGKHDFMGAMRLYAKLHVSADSEDLLTQAK